MVQKYPFGKNSKSVVLKAPTIHLKFPLQNERASREVFNDHYSDKIFESVNYPLLVLDKELRVTRANPSFYRVFKMTRKETQGRMFRCAKGNGAHAGRLRKLFLQVFQHKAFEAEIECELVKGSVRLVLMKAQPLFSNPQLPPLILLSLEDITMQRHSQEVRELLFLKLEKLSHELEDRVAARTSELQKVNAKLKTLSARLLEAQELERRHLARELHDEIGQQITCLQILTQNQFEVAPPSLKGALKETKSATADLLKTVRQLSSKLRPQLLDDFGVVAALEWHYKRFHKRTGIDIQLDKKYFQEDLLNSFLRNVLFRVAQEALTNVVRHAHTNKVKVVISTRNGVCRMEVRDKGQGFNVREALRKGSFGLVGMQERVFLAGGKLKFVSTPGKGTTVALQLPLISLQSDAVDPEPLGK